MPPPLSILLIEDSDDDALLIIAETQVTGRDVSFHRIQTETELRDALHEPHWDAVLSDYQLPGFSGLAALAIVQQHDPDLPFLVVSGAIGEETAVEAMRAGAHDYIMKGNLSRLSPAVEREVREAVERRAGRRAEVDREQSLVREREARILAEKAVERTARLQALTAALSRAVTPGDVAAVVVNQGALATGAIGAGVSTLLEDGLTLQTLCALGPLPEDIEHYRTVSLRDDTPLAEVVRTGLPAWLPPVQQWESRYSDVAQAFTRAGYRAAVILPISAHDRTIGALSFGFGDERVLCEDDRAFLLSLTQQCAQALDRASLDESVRQSGARFHAQFLGFPIPTYIWQVSGDDLVVVDFNNAGDAITQQRIRAIIGTPARVMFAEHPEILEDFARCLRERKTIRREMHYRLPTVDTEHDFVVHYVFVPPDLVMVHTEDVTDRVQAAQHLHFQARLLDTVGQAVVASTPDGEITYWNHGADRLFGYHAEEVIGRNVVEVLPTTRSVTESRRILDTIRAGEEMVDEFLIRRRDGAMVPVLSHRTPIRDEIGTITGIIGVSSDISELKEVEQELRRSEERFRAIFDQAAVGMAQSTLDGQFLLVNNYFLTFLGYTRDEILQKSYQEITHPDDLDANLAQYLRLVDGSIKLYRHETRYIRKDGTSRWAEVASSLMVDEQGHPRHTLAVIVDLDARKQAEIAVRESEQRYRALVETSPDGILLNDMRGLIVMANQQLATMLGYDTANELNGVSIGAHLADAERRRAFEILELRIQETVPTASYTRYSVLRRDGTTFPAEVNSYRVPDGSGKAGFVTSTVRDISERVAYEAQLEHLALHDSLTGLANRTLLYDRLQQTLAGARRNGESLAVLLLDLDHFKDINDTFGHHVGDGVIREVAVRLTAILRGVDTLARLGGDEYALLLPKTDLLGALETATKLTYALEQPIDLDEQRVHVGASIGIALYPDHAADPDTILRHADVAMYSAKQANGGYAVYAAEKDSYSPTRLALSGELRDAIRSDELVLYFQPKMRLASGEIDGVEALVRWNHPEHGLIPPDQFIPLAEHSGLIRPLTTWVIDKALKQCRDWRDLNFTVGVAVNLSVRSLHDPDLPRVIMGSLAASDVPPSQLTVEITESVIMADPDHAMDMLEQLTNVGIKLSIDDFGTGYSSLAYLRHLRVHELKIDKSFVMDLDTNDDNRVIVRSVIELGHNLGLEVVAEGVESQATLDILGLLQCERAQGYHLSRPQTAADITTWLQERIARRRRQEPGRPSHIAVIEDEEHIFDMLKSVLTLEGYSVAVLRHPALLDSLSPEQPPDLFLIDIMLPGMSGIDVAKQLYARGFGDVPMIAMSASDLLLQTAEGTELFRAQIGKPFDLHELLSLIASAISARTE